RSSASRSSLQAPLTERVAAPWAFGQHLLCRSPAVSACSNSKCRLRPRLLTPTPQSLSQATGALLVWLPRRQSASKCRFLMRTRNPSPILASVPKAPNAPRALSGSDRLDFFACIAESPRQVATAHPERLRSSAGRHLSEWRRALRGSSLL